MNIVEKSKLGLHRREQVRFRLTEEPWKVNMGLGVENTFIQKKVEAETGLAYRENFELIGGIEI